MKNRFRLHQTQPKQVRQQPKLQLKKSRKARDREVLEAEMTTAAAAAEAAAQAAETEEARQERARQMQEAENNQERKEMWNDFIETMRDSLEELKNMPHACKLEPRSYLLH